MGTQDFPFGNNAVSAAPAGPDVGVVAPGRACPLCRGTVQPDVLGLVECACGWGGPDDPLEAAHGFSRFVMRIDRQLATRQGHGELSSIAERAGKARKIGVVYRAALFGGATFVYLLVLAVLASAVLLVYMGIRDRAWIALGIGVLVLLLLALPIVEHRSRHAEIRVTEQGHPALFAMLREVEASVGIPIPRRVVVSPGAVFSVGRRHPLGRAFFPETVLTLGVAAFPLLSAEEVKAIVAHELAHYRHGDTLFAHYTGWAEILLQEVIGALMSAVTSQRQAIERDTRVIQFGGSGVQSIGNLGALIVAIVTLPLGIALVLFHLLRVHASRAAEFQADAIAVRAYGPSAFIDGLTGSIIAQRTLRNSGRRLLLSGPNYFANAEKHYQALPSSALRALRAETLRGYRSLEHTHPITSDRVRAALLVATHGQQGTPMAPPAAPKTSSRGLLVGAGESSPERVEVELTALLRGERKTRKRRGAR